MKKSFKKQFHRLASLASAAILSLGFFSGAGYHALFASAEGETNVAKGKRASCAFPCYVEKFADGNAFSTDLCLTDGLTDDAPDGQWFSWRTNFGYTETPFLTVDVDIDLEYECELDYVVLWPGFPSEKGWTPSQRPDENSYHCMPRDCEVQVSSDSVNYKTVGRIVNDSDRTDRTPRKIQLDNGAKGRYFRLHMQRAQDYADIFDGFWGYCYTLSEIEVFGNKYVDKSTLNALYEENKGKLQNNYTAESWAAFTQALETAKTLLEDRTASSEAVESATKALQDAITGLKDSQTLKSKPFKNLFRKRKAAKSQLYGRELERILDRSEKRENSP